MSPELRAEFERHWPGLSVRLDRFLASRRVSPSLRDDLIQETAIRLYGMWTKVDRSRHPWPLTMTIALNLLRDAGRASRHGEICAELPDLAGSQHVEAAGLARVELGRIAEALEELPTLQRAALMRELGENDAAFTTREAEKMLRMRARKRLRSILERVSGLVLLRARRDPSDVNAALMARDGMTHIATCVACAVLGLAAGVVPNLAAPPAGATEKVLPQRNRSAAIRSMSDEPVPSAAGVARANTVVRAAAIAPTGKRSESASAKASQPATQVPAASVPVTQDVPLQPPSIEPPVEAPAEPPSLPAPTELPQPDDAPLDPAAVVEEVTGALGAAD